MLGYTPFATGSPADILAVLALAIGLGVPDVRRGLRDPDFLSGVLVLAGLLVVASATSPVIRQAVPAAVKILLWVALARLLYQAPHRERVAMARVIVVTAGLYALVGTGLGLAGILVGELPGTQHYPSFPLGFAAVRFVGFFPTANDVALVFVLAILLAPLADLGDRRRLICILIILLTGLSLTWSRLFVLGFLAIAFSHEFRGRRLVVAAALLVFFGAEWLTHVAMTREPTVASLWIARQQPFAEVGPYFLWRMGYLELKQAAISMWLDHPFCGVGLRGFGPALVSHVDPEIAAVLPAIGTTPHSTVGMIFAELGGIGVIVCAYLAYRLYRSGNGRSIIWLGSMLVLSLVAIDYELQHHRLVFLGIALAAAPARPEARRGASEATEEALDFTR